MGKKTRERLAAQGIVLPDARDKSVPVGKYLMVKRWGTLVAVSGMGPWPDGPHGSPTAGKMTPSTDMALGYEAARQVALGMLRELDDEFGLNRLDLIQTFGFVNADPSFTRNPEVINGFSDTMEKALGPKRGVGTRWAIGQSSLPFDIMVEVACVFGLRPKRKDKKKSSRKRRG